MQLSRNHPHMICCPTQQRYRYSSHGVQCRRLSPTRSSTFLRLCFRRHDIPGVCATPFGEPIRKRTGRHQLPEGLQHRRHLAQWHLGEGWAASRGCHPSGFERLRRGVRRRMQCLCVNGSARGFYKQLRAARGQGLRAQFPVSIQPLCCGVQPSVCVRLSLCAILGTSRF